MKETLEELAEKYSIEEFPLKDFEGTQWNNQRENCKQDFLVGAKTGAKLQQEKDKNKYSEEEVKNLLNKRMLSVGIFSSEKATNIWFKQYTKTI